ncbi:TetR/AcrR family transcriptional regulator [Maricaulis maris]|uniref:TetR family transcriptional regulator n=1 Tax=Maricaulis maris TaxID=74318 RepID=A0A495CY42_9PROT|nr:TetR/AcrR family transcriptional regulator [Maricaulis maris]RKQ94195.1 TetR family transcriptional regulator [Maricaulis maris]
MTTASQPVTPPRRRNAEATKARLMAAGEALFSAHGFAATTLDNIAGHAEANKAMVRYYFGDKDGLYTAIIETIIDDVLANLESALAAPADPVADMGDFIEIFARAIISRPSFPRMILRDYLDGDIMTREGPARKLRGFMDTTRRFYLAGRAAGRFREVDPHMLHLSIVGAAIFFSITRRIRSTLSTHQGMADFEIEVAPFTRHLRDLVLSGITSHKG